LQILAVRVEFDLDEADALLGIKTAQMPLEARRKAIAGRLPRPAEAHAALLATATAEIARLQAHRDDLWFRVDGPRLAEAIDLATFDDTKQGDLRRRYESAAMLDMHRALTRLEHKRRERKQDHRDGTEAARMEASGWVQSASSPAPLTASDVARAAQRTAPPPVTTPPTSPPAPARPPIPNEPNPGTSEYRPSSSVDEQGRRMEPPDPRAASRADQAQAPAPHQRPAPPPVAPPKPAPGTNSPG
jgi:hypothetical protein